METDHLYVPMNSDREQKRHKSVSAPRETIMSPTNFQTDEIATRLNKMSMEDRDEALYELHGIANLPEETSSMIMSKLAEMNEVLSSSVIDSAGDASSYRKAMSMNSDYVEELKLPFLRAASPMYNSRDAAANLLKFFDQKLDFFGEDKLVKEIELEDLNEEDRQALFDGAVQVLPHHDRSGRIVLFRWATVAVHIKFESLLRIDFFLAMLAVRRDEEGQKRGVVYIYSALGLQNLPPSFVFNIPSRIEQTFRLWNMLPLQVRAIHICRDDLGGKFSSIVSRATRSCQVYSKDKLLVKIRIHCGSPLEVIYTLMTFGVPKEAIPITDDGSIDLTVHQAMINALKSTDRVGSLGRGRELKAGDGQEEIVLQPGPKDIVMGRGRRPTRNQGSQMMYQLIHHMKDEYEVGRKKQKMDIAAKILRMLNEEGCRFVKEKEGGGYEECEASAARAKISHSFRNERSRSQARGDRRQRPEEETNGRITNGNG